MTAKLYRVESVDAGQSHHFSQTGDRMRIASSLIARRGKCLPAAAPPRRAAFTLIELLVVVAVIAVLVALLIPAVIQSRGAARRAQCSNNLKQLASATQQFHNRMDSLPIYWGAMKNRGGELFGGWLLHMLPELDEQVFFDSLPRSGTANRLVYAWQDLGFTLPAVPPSADYDPGTWVTGTTQVTMASGNVIWITTNTLVGRRGTGGAPERRAWGWRVTGTQALTAGMGGNADLATFGQAQSRKSLGFLQCGDDPSTLPPNSMVPISTVVGTSTTTWPWSLTNYQANAHVFTKFGSARIGPTAASGTMGYYFNASLVSNAGLYLPPLPQTSTGTSWGGIGTFYSHSVAGSTSTLPRTFGHVTDGLSNTILFAEGMRQCDGGAVNRFAFLPCGRWTHEHSFGIEPSFTGTNSATVYNGSIGPSVTATFPAGNTLRFQSRPAVATCNSFRIQANHGRYLMAVMCDGAVRAISSAVDAREQVTAEASGRDHYGTPFYTADSRGGNLPPGENPDGIWDMLMVPADPPRNVLINTGEIGKERRYQ